MNSWFAERLGWTLLQPNALWLVLAIPLAWGLRRHATPPSLPFAPMRLLPERGLPSTLRQRLRGVPDLLLTAGTLLLVIAIARPAALEVLPRRSLGVDLMIAIDRSSSMNESGLDGQRTRLEVVKECADRFLEWRTGDRIGLIAFARYPDLICAPTLHVESARERLAELEPVPVDDPEDLTGIGVAAARAAEILRRAPGPARVLILLSDGEENVAGAHAPQALTPTEAAELCRAWGVRVHVIATGDRAPGSVSGLDVLARLTGGTHHSAEDVGALTRIYQALDELEPSPLSEPESRVRERGSRFAIAAMLLVAVGALLRRRGWEAGP